jgi:hypothetical protein
MHRPLSTGAAVVATTAAVLLAGAPGARAKPAKEAPAWATVNACDPPKAPGRLGVRAFVPRRGAAEQWLRIRAQWWDAAAGKWRWVTKGGDGGWAKVGNGRTARYGGVDFVFDPPDAGHRLLLRGVANVEWRSGRKVVDRARVRTTGGHRNAKDPALRVSQRTCEIRR